MSRSVLRRMFGDEPVDRVEEERERVVVGHRCGSDAGGVDLGRELFDERGEIWGRETRRAGRWRRSRRSRRSPPPRAGRRRPASRPAKGARELRSVRCPSLSYERRTSRHSVSPSAISPRFTRHRRDQEPADDRAVLSLRAVDARGFLGRFEHARRIGTGGRTHDRLQRLQPDHRPALPACDGERLLGDRQARGPSRASLRPWRASPGSRRVGPGHLRGGPARPRGAPTKRRARDRRPRRRPSPP